ncbi:thiopeptide-type bacteriocin biosynthesis protein [Nostoc sp. ChiSLP03a]|uniref:thiopeptide-type bacteriocin biosynthesis protein n=1 Tax=Nostoc sp. ChiSLP03a TaxID=3075380 RepID=UPI002AD49DF5|nr:thiopeptide-type bacteriocin biosynthesis protein [Nostoc sp. ChiSLP03a]MDZ8216066.1 thiopeptide-type bacteriocin biosynthesis protein [Nostoc sp. ChiSLP03a]
MTDESTSITQASSQDWENGDWVQLNVGLVRHQGNALSSARALFARLEPLVTYWQSNDLLRCFFFMRKPPDVRVRFFTTVDRQQAIADISDLMYALRRENLINLFFFSDYEPETDRFGGLEAMKLVHQHFDADTSLWLMLDYLDRHNLGVISKDLLVPTVLHDLFTRTLSDPVAILATWHSLSALISTPPEGTIPTIELLSLETLYDLKEAEILQKYATANDILAKELLNLQHLGQLTQDLVDILAAVAMFNFHRHGFDSHRSGRLIEGIIRTLEGKNAEG